MEENERTNSTMEIWKLVSGILSIIFFALSSLQSCAVGVSNTLSNNGEVSGAAGIILSMFMLAGGIVLVVTRKSKEIGSNVALIILFGVAAFFGFSLTGSFKDLAIWASWCLINVVIALITILLSVKDISRLIPSEKQCYKGIMVMFALFVAVIVVMVILRKTILPV